PRAGPAPGTAEESAGPRVLDGVVDRLRGKGRAAPQVWLPPLGAPTTIGKLLPDLHLDPARGLCAAARLHGRLQVPLGEVDLPFEQRRAQPTGRVQIGRAHV